MKFQIQYFSNILFVIGQRQGHLGDDTSRMERESVLFVIIKLG